MALVLFVFWIVLSGKFDFFHLAAGALAATGVAFLSCYVYALDPPVGPAGQHPYYTMPWVRLALYFPWLSWQILVASIQVARIVLSPSIRIAPIVVQFEYVLPHNLARATLANSITLTPGTVTVDVRGDEYLVHALNPAAAEELQASRPGVMKDRVSKIFGKAS